MATSKKFVLITGCSAGGIGAGLADVFREKGYHVFPTVRNISKLPSTLYKASNVTPLTLDVLSSESITAAASEVNKHTGGRLDVLVNNSGQTMMLPALDVDIKEARNIFDLNFWAPLAMMQAFAPLLIEAKGCIVNNSSAAAYVPMTFSSIYNSSKAALSAGSETWRRELEPLGVRIVTLVTTGVKTQAFENIEKPKIPETSYYYVIRDYIERMADGRLQEGSPDARTFALEVIEAIEKGRSGEVWAGKDAAVNRWALNHLPQWLFDMILDNFLKVSGELAKVAQVMKTRK